MLIVPTWTLFNIIFYIGLGVLTVSLPYSDYHGLWTLQYSKFVKGDGIPSRTAMFILYFLPVVTATDGMVIFILRQFYSIDCLWLGEYSFCQAGTGNLISS